MAVVGAFVELTGDESDVGPLSRGCAPLPRWTPRGVRRLQLGPES
jgi:hypothetical protein